MALETLIHANPIDYVILIAYFAFVLGIGYMARHQVSGSLDFFLSGRRLPAWVTGLAFVSANLGAVEIMGMSANGAQLGLPTLHYFWVGAIPAMLFLGVVMMPFYYGSGVRSVPEFMLKRFGPAAHLVNSISFALAQLLIAGVNLYLLGSIVQALLGWPLWVALVVAALIVLSYITFGGLSAAIYNEVLQFFVIVASLLPVVIIGLHRVGGWSGLKARIVSAAAAHPGVIPPASQQLHSWPGQDLSGFSNPVLSVIGIIFGLGFVLGFGYWTTNFVEVQRAMATKSLSDARRTPIIGTFAKMLIPFLTVFPGLLAAVLVPEIASTKAGHVVSGGTSGTVTYNDSVILLIRDVLPNGLVGLAITGLLAAFMAGMAANISAFNTVFSVDIWQRYVIKDHPDGYYVKVGRFATAAACMIAIGTAAFASNYSNIMTYLQTLFGFFNAPLFATFILGMFWKRMTPAAGWSGLASGTIGALIVWLLGAPPGGAGVIGPVYSLAGQGTSFVAAGVAFTLDILVSVVVSLFTAPKPAEQLVGLVYSETPREALTDPEEKNNPWYKRTLPLAGLSLVLVIILNFLF
ncbi:sodium:solute symporter family protein [Acidipropionibacterium jensenii]|uniref:sodium:solute symporter family protein n=2 Tax=Acidipropionibacterium jensenii TaxID=1749 RepID=UPI002647FA48|nr:sodium:solute symporter family protein [Acidipropionibacterium jensenii]MDN6556540.1 sodium:solute symporter family protein [Acidipropionibacterium acidipropionici]MDN5978291.1 sodium:solute symporter family protein [Acidipropionibacterium jensenii]MDN5997341.1 sodium:solute symporter family protein [Acidipropionibacterium jensenii]MDN6427937.1 sodium:solute symporter family protein [Acidipropionibacterium jensenii]MDN6481139.1 sodium:solute symporter family protein [Acidipropionibacterium 